MKKHLILMIAVCIATLSAATNMQLNDQLANSIDYTKEIVFSESFEGTAFPPTGWTGNIWEKVSGGIDGSSCAKIHYTHQGSPAIEAKLTTPQILLSSNSTLKFWWRDHDNVVKQSKVAGHDSTICEISTNGTNWSRLTFLSPSAPMSAFQEVEISLNAYTGNSVYLRWRDKTDGTSAAWGTGLDKITIEKNSAVPQISINQTALDFGVLPMTSAATPLLLNISNTGGANLVIDSIKTTLPFSVLNGWTSQIVPGNSANVSIGISTAQAGIFKDSVKVYSNAGVRTVQLKAELYNPATYLLYENFDTPWSAQNPPTGWKIYDLATPVSGNVPDPVFGNHNDWHPFIWSTGNYGTGTQAARVAYLSVESQDEWLISPAVNLTNANNASLSFDHYFQKNNLSTPDHKATIAYSTDFNPATMTSPAQANWFLVSMFSATSYGIQTLGLNNACGNNNVRIAFRYYDVTDGLPWYVDNVRLSINSSEINTNQTVLQTTLVSNYPNPFNPETTINYELKSSEMTSLIIYNSKGELVSKLFNGMQTAGAHSLKFNAVGLNSGVYFCKLQTGNQSIVKSMLLLK